jgi:hypothetical protein
MSNYSLMMVAELKQECKKLGFKNYSKLKKQELLNLLTNPNQKNTLEKRKIGKKQREILWNLHFGEDSRSGNCYVCNDKMDILHFEAGHIIAFANGGNDCIDNLRPICLQCNRGMGTENLEEYKSKIVSKDMNMENILMKNGEKISLLDEKYIIVHDLRHILARDFKIDINYNKWGDADSEYGRLQLNNDQVNRIKLQKLGFNVIAIPSRTGLPHSFHYVEWEDVKKYYMNNFNKFIL